MSARGKQRKVQERRTQVLRMRRAGHSYAEIATALGITPEVARKDVQRGLSHALQEAATDLVRLEAMRLDAAQAGIWDKVLAGDTTAVREFVRLSERRSRMLGLDRQAELFAQAAEQETAGSIMSRFMDAARLMYDAQQGDPDDPHTGAAAGVDN